MNNELDYENDLVFEPKSADDLNKQERQSDVLISAIERCEMLEKQLEIAVNALKKIEILIALNLVDKSKISTAYKLSHQALAKIKEIK